MSHIHLKEIKTTAPKGLDKKKVLKENAKLISEIQADQYKLFAESKRSVLIILQGMDASGKDGVVRYIFSGMNPLGTRACGFRVPTKEEASHDFLWRIHKQVPAKGMVQIFNRSHYEDILVPTVEKYLSKEEIEQRYSQISNFEKMLEENGTIILKFYLHVSKTKQKEKLNERLTDPTKYRKHNIGDRQTRDEYNQYMEVYEKVFAECNHPERHIIPADQNRYKINCIAKILHKTFKDLNLKWPKLSEDQETSLLRAKAELEESKEDEKENKESDKIDKEVFEKKLEKELAKEIAKMKKEEDKKIKKMKKDEEKKAKEASKIESNNTKAKKKEEKKAKKLKKEEEKKKKHHKETPKIKVVAVKKKVTIKKPIAKTIVKKSTPTKVGSATITKPSTTLVKKAVVKKITTPKAIIKSAPKKPMVKKTTLKK